MGATHTRLWAEQREMVLSPRPGCPSAWAQLTSCLGPATYRILHPPRPVATTPCTWGLGSSVPNQPSTLACSSSSVTA